MRLVEKNGYSLETRLIRGLLIAALAKIQPSVEVKGGAELNILK